MDSNVTCRKCTMPIPFHSDKCPSCGEDINVRIHLPRETIRIKVEGDLNETQRIMISHVVVNMLLKSPDFWVVVVALGVVGLLSGGAWFSSRLDKRVAEVNAQIDRMFATPEINRIVEDAAKRRAEDII